MIEHAHEAQLLPLAAPLQAASSASRLDYLALTRWVLLALVVIGIGLRLWLVAINPIDPASSTADDGDYYRRALRLALTGEYRDDFWLIRPPGHVALFAAGLRLGVAAGDLSLGLLAIKLAQVGISALQVLLGYGVAARLFRNRSAGLLYAAFLALWYPFVEQPSLLFSELLFNTLFLAHMWFLLRYDRANRWANLAIAGLILGVAALVRSPALYSLAFVALWLLVRWWLQTGRSILRLCGELALITVCTLVVVLPWTTRNYVMYQHLIPVDTLGQVNLWLDLEEPALRVPKIEELRTMPQGERAAYAQTKAREILARDPLALVRNAWPHFQHVWKAQFVEDYYLRESFYDRPLRQAAPLGLFGDLMWLIFTGAGLFGLAAPVREGWHNRLFVLAWLGYTLATVIVFHVEPRYLLPLWMLIALYGAGTLTGIRGQASGVKIARYLLPSVVLLAFLVLLFSYRNYPAMIVQGRVREQAMRAGDSAFARGEYMAAEQHYRAALAVQPNFEDATVQIALSQLARGQREQAAATAAQSERRTAWLAGLVAKGGGPEHVADLTFAEATTGLDVQTWAQRWTPPLPTRNIHLGDGRDMGYVSGFSAAEADGSGTFRWMTGKAHIRVPLPTQLEPGATVAIRLATPDSRPLTITLNGVAQTIEATPGQWRTYLLPIPIEQASNTLEIDLRAPVFYPALRDPASDDLRQLSVMISDIYVR